MKERYVYAPTYRHTIALWVFSFFPNILLVALCNSRAFPPYDENSDIDLFVITKRRQLWTVRCIITCFSILLGVRRWNTHGLAKWSPEYIKKTKEKFCLSFFITEDAMDFSSIRLKPTDPYLDRWIETLIPLVNKNKTLERFWAANGINKLEKEKKQSPFLLCALCFVLWVFESFIKRIWLKKTLRTYEKLWKPWWVIVSDTMLKFHDDDQRKVYRDNKKVY